MSGSPAWRQLEGCPHLSATSSLPPQAHPVGWGTDGTKGGPSHNYTRSPKTSGKGLELSFSSLRNSAPATAPHQHRGCHQCHELAGLCSQSLKEAVHTGSRVSDCTLGILTDPLGCSWPPGRGTAKKGAHTTPSCFTLLNSAVVHGRGPCLCPCPQLGWGREAEFLRVDADVSFSAAPLRAGPGACPGWQRDRPSPQLSSQLPVPMTALSGTRPQEGPGGCWRLLWESAGVSSYSFMMERLRAGHWQGLAAPYHAPARPIELEGGLG